MASLRSPLRQRILVRSAADLLDDPSIDLAAYGWRRHPWTYAYSIGAAAAVGGLGWVLGFVPVVCLGLAVAAGTVAATATTDYRVIASGPDRLAMCRSSRIRQFARTHLFDLESPADVLPVGGTLIATDWQIGDEPPLTIAKSSESMMDRIAARHGHR